MKYYKSIKKIVGIGMIVGILFLGSYDSQSNIIPPDGGTTNRCCKDPSSNATTCRTDCSSLKPKCDSNGKC